MKTAEEFNEKKQDRQEAANQPVPASLTVPTDVPTLAEAYAKIPEGGTIFLNRGVHTVPKTITITKKVMITGEVSNPEYIVLQGGEESVFHLQSGFAEIAGLTIQNEGKERPEDFPEDEEPAFAARYSAFVVSAPLCTIHDCVFVSRNCGGFVVNTKDSNPDVKNSAASGNAEAGMEVRDAQSNPTVEDCRFTDGKSNGIIVIL